MGDYASNDSSCEEAGLCSYELKRLENIRKNQEILKSLGLPVRDTTQKKAKKSIGVRQRGRKNKGSDDSDGEEWQPWKEMQQTRRKPKGRAAGRVKLAPLDPVCKNQILTSVNAQVKQCFKDAFNGCVSKPSPPKKLRLSNQPQRQKRPSSLPPPTIPLQLPDFFDSDEEESDFYGFPAEAVLSGVASSNEFTYYLPQKWKHLFDSGLEEDDFDGFTKQELAETPLPARHMKRYPKRVNDRRKYQEDELSDEDEYLYCEDCDTLHHGDCPIHGPLMTLDADSGYDEASRNFTDLPVPAELTIKSSLIPNAGLGVFAKKFIPRGIKVGPYEGKLVWKDHVDEGIDTSYMWEIRREGEKAYYIDGKDPTSSNWLRFINCARNEEEQNMVAFQYRGQIFYRTFKHIYPGTELLVWYGEEYARELGISTDPEGVMLANFRCKGCGSTFVENKSLQVHLKGSSKCAAATPQVFKCQKCLQLFSELYQLQYHIRRHEEMRDLQQSRHSNQTSQLQHIQETKRLITENLENHSRSDYRKSFSQSSALQKHIRTHTGDKPYKCEYCGKSFSQSGNLQTHIRTHTGDKPYKCEYCGKNFNQSGVLQTHIRTHTGDKPYKCEYCGKSFSQNVVLQKHIRTHTGDKPYKCEYCGKSFSVSSALQTHIRTHTGDKPYKCEYCGKSFNQSSALQTHIRTHTGDKPYKCEYCGKSFSVSSALQTHIRTHTGDKPYKCEYCGKSFSVSGALQTHIRTHTGDKPYKCEYCGKSFNQSGNLQKHIRTHTGDKPLQM